MQVYGTFINASVPTTQQFLNFDDFMKSKQRKVISVQVSMRVVVSD